MTTEANTDDFEAEMGSNPMGRRIRIRALGPYVLELYDRLLFADKRAREGKPEQQRITVWTPAEDHWRQYRKVGECKAEAGDIGGMWSAFDTADDVAEWIEEHPATDD